MGEERGMRVGGGEDRFDLLLLLVDLRFQRNQISHLVGLARESAWSTNVNQCMVSLGKLRYGVSYSM